MTQLVFRNVKLQPLTYAEMDNNFKILEQIQLTGAPTWDSGLTYATGTVVLGSDGKNYIALSNNTNQDPTTDNGVNWDNTYFTILREIQTQGAQSWDNTISYNVGAWVVGSNDVLYRAVEPSINEDPIADTNNDFWDDHYYFTRLEAQSYADNTALVFSIGLS